MDRKEQIALLNTTGFREAGSLLNVVLHIRIFVVYIILEIKFTALVHNYIFFLTVLVRPNRLLRREMTFLTRWRTQD